MGIPGTVLICPKNLSNIVLFCDEKTSKKYCNIRHFDVLYIRKFLILIFVLNSLYLVMEWIRFKNIVLLILAGVTIAALSGDNGILQRASEAK